MFYPSAQLVPVTVLPDPIVARSSGGTHTLVNEPAQLRVLLRLRPTGRALILLHLSHLLYIPAFDTHCCCQEKIMYNTKKTPDLKCENQANRTRQKSYELMLVMSSLFVYEAKLIHRYAHMFVVSKYVCLVSVSSQEILSVEEMCRDFKSASVNDYSPAALR